MDSPKVNRATEQFLQEHGRVPSTHELATMTGIDEELVISAFEANGRSTSIDAPISEDDDNSLADTLSSDDDSARSDSSLDRESMNLFISDLLKEVLNDREQRIITESFGIGRMEKSLEEIADEMGMTRERIRQVKEKALRKIRNSKYAVSLRQYLG